MSRSGPFLGSSCLAVALAGVIAPSLPAQYNERPDLAGSGSAAVDVSGRSVKNKRVRAVHEENALLEGGTAFFLEYDPFLAYQLGRNLNFREFRTRDGVFDHTVSSLGGPMPDGTTAKITADNQTSCSGCHNLPQGNAGGGPNFHKDSGLGRNTPHYYGSGIVEMLALQVRAEMLQQLDQNNDGWVSASEANAGGNAIHVEASPGGALIDYGRPSLSNGDTGTPALNNIFNVWYVDAAGQVVPGATEVDQITTFGYNFAMIVWGWGQGGGRTALNPTNRAFLWDPWKAHGGLEAYDPTSNDDPDGDGLSAPSLSGAIQFPVSHQTADQGAVLDPFGFSRDDPDGDGTLNEISEGDLDLAEWFMLNAPRPAFAGTPHQYRKGVDMLEDLGCAECHVPRWEIHEKHGPFAGDRRFFDLDVAWNAKQQRLEGRLDRLYTIRGGRYERFFDFFLVDGLFTDFRHHDLGEDAHEIDFGGTVNTLFRTPPLWGLGSSFPYMHDGQSLTVHDAILRHGGDAADSARAYKKLGKGKQRQLLAFLDRLVLYDVESLPADIDGDHKIDNNFHVAGQNTGMERFNAEWLFEVPLMIQGDFVNIDGEVVRSFAGTNIADAYGELLPLRLDSDDDGWPDVWDHEPFVTGYKDGEN